MGNCPTTGEKCGSSGCGNGCVKMNATPTPTPRTEKLLAGYKAFNLANWVSEYKQLEKELTAAREEIERLQCSGIHSCHDNCERPNCVLRREIKAVTEQRDRLAEAIRLTLMDNLDLCDGDICTLKRLKDAVGFDLDSLENASLSHGDESES